MTAAQERRLLRAALDYVKWDDVQRDAKRRHRALGYHPDGWPAKERKIAAECHRQRKEAVHQRALARERMRRAAGLNRAQKELPRP